MATDKFVKAVNSNHVCMDCGKKIKVGVLYYYNHIQYKGEKVKYIYCKKCKNKPEHNRVSYDHEAILMDLMNTPMFKHEFESRYALDLPEKSNNLMRRLAINGYPVGIFRWSMRSRNSKIGEKENYRHGHQPNHFIIYYIRGTENKVVSRILDEFDFEHIRWRDLLRSLYGRKIPIAMTSKETIKQWAEQNVY